MTNWSRARPSSVRTPSAPYSGVDEVARLFDDPSEHHRQMQLGVEDEDRLNQASQPDGIVDTVERLHGPPG